jgi:hypothetical protein
MTQKRGKRSQKGNVPWLVIILGGVLLLVAAGLFFVNRSGAGGGGTPAIAVDPQSIDYGDQALGTNLTFEIEVTNRGDGALRFKEEPYIEIVEGC